MSPKIVERKKNKALKKIQTFVPKNLNIKKIKINPINIQINWTFKNLNAL